MVVLQAAPSQPVPSPGGLLSSSTMLSTSTLAAALGVPPKWIACSIQTCSIKTLTEPSLRPR